MPDFLGLADKAAAKGKYSKASYLVLRHIADQLAPDYTVSGNLVVGKNPAAEAFMAGMAQMAQNDTLPGPRTWDTLADIPADVNKVVDEPNDDGQALASRGGAAEDDTGWSYVMISGPFENYGGGGADLKGPFTEYLD